MSADDFWTHVDSVNAGMLDASDGDRLVPMSHYADRDRNTLWFISAAGTDAVDAATSGAVPCAYVLADGGKGLYAHVRGELSVSNDVAKLEELWNPIAEAWFDGGRQDPDIRLLSLVISGAEVWITSTSGIRFMFNVARAHLTGQQPEMGQHFSL